MDDNSAISRETGLAQYEGDEKIFENILKGFAKNNKDVLKNLDNALSAGNITLAHRLAHSLRGSAGAIGAKRLAAAACDMEGALSGQKEPPADTEARLSLLTKEFEAVFDELSPLIIEEELSQNYADNLDRESMLCLIEKLSPFLEVGDTKCLEYLDEIAQTFRPAEHSFRLLVKQIEYYDFDQAYDTIRDIKRFLSPQI